MRRVILIFSGLVIVVVVLGVFLLLGGGGREKALPDGSLIRIEKVAFGKEERFALGGRVQQFKKMVAEFWRTHISHTTAPMRNGMSSWYQNAVMRTNEPALYIYVSRSDPGKGYRSVDAQTAELIDEDGCVFTATQSGGWENGDLPASSTRGGMNYSVGWFRFEAFPRGQKKFRFMIHENTWPAPVTHHGSVEFLVANPMPPSATAKWPVEPLPITLTQGKVSFILSSVSVQTNGQQDFTGGAAKVVETAYKFKEDGEPSTNWQAVTAELYDSSGNFVSDHFPYAPCAPLCTREAAWKLKVKFFGTDKSRAASNAVWTIHNLKVPGAGESMRVGQSNVLQGVGISVAAIGGAGDFNYSNGIALKAAPLKKGGANKTSLLVWPNNWTGKNSITKPTFELQTKKPHLAIELGDLSDDQKFTACAVDEQGREYYGYKVYGGWDDHNPKEANYISNWYDSEGSFLHFDLPADVKTVDLILCVHTCRTGEFVFKPPQVVAPLAKK